MKPFSQSAPLSIPTLGTLIAVLLALGCGDDKAKTPATDPEAAGEKQPTPLTPPVKPPSVSARKPLGVGSDAPNFSLEAHDGSTVDLAKIGGPVVLYFYPKDETPG